MNRLFRLLFLLVLLFGFAGAADAVTEKKKFVLVIDAGHGGKDPGAVTRRAKEKTINLNVALEFGRLVQKNCPDVKVVYTRSKDVFLSLQRRADIANNAKADLFVSIHTNALPKGRIAYGTETYTLGMHRAAENLELAKRENAVITYEANYKETYEGFDPNKTESYIIFEFLQDHNMKQSVNLARCIQKQYTNYAGRKDKGVHQAGLLVLRMTTMPAVLTELGFISTPAEERFLVSSAGVQKMARALYNGFMEYRKKYDHTGKALHNPEPVVEEVVEDREEETASEPSRTTPGEASGTGKLVFKLQLFVHSKALPASSKLFKGLKGVTHYKEGGMYKYTYGSSSDVNEIRKLRTKVKGKFPEAFPVAFVNGKRVDLQKAIKMAK